MIINGDCIEEMQKLIDQGVQVDAVVTDPPYHLQSIVDRFGKTSLSDDTKTSERARGRSDGYARMSAGGFMGQEWDGGDIAFRAETWRLAWELLKPGGHLLAFSASRNYHRMAVAIEDAGFEIRDQMMWLYGSGFPKSHNISKSLDKLGGKLGKSVLELKIKLIEAVEKCSKTRKQIDTECGFRATNYLTLPKDDKKYDPWVDLLPNDDKWQKMKFVIGMDNSLDEIFTSATRDIVGVRKISKGVAFTSEGLSEIDITAPATDQAKQWEGWGTALKPAHEPIAVGRKPLSESTVAKNVLKHGTGGINIDASRIPTNLDDDNLRPNALNHNKTKAADIYSKYKVGADVQTQDNGYHSTKGRFPANIMHDGSEVITDGFPNTKSGKDKNPTTKNVSGFFGQDMGYYSKDANYGDEGSASRFFYCPKVSKKERGENNKHPTVKPQELMKYLVRLVTPKGGTVLDPFMGSGSTGMAAKDLGFDFIGIEKSEEYFKICQERIDETNPLSEFFD